MTPQERAQAKRNRRALRKDASRYAVANAVNRQPWSRGPRMPSQKTMREALQRGERVLPA